jgi:hypothetical protein
LLSLQVESQHPKLTQFVNHWATEFLLKESFANHYGYNRKLTGATSNLKATSKHCDSSDNDQSDNKKPQAHDACKVINAARRVAVQKARHRADADDGDPTPETTACKNAAHRAAAYWAAERKAKCKAEESTDGDASDKTLFPDNDGDTELEDLPDRVRRAIERTEIGVPGKLTNYPTKCNG